jgi:tetratricopeptide (TPR) repeat protein
VGPPTGEAAGAPRGSSSGDEPTRITERGSAARAGAPAAPIPLGPSIEGYTLKEEIHRGGQGIVYRAVQLGTKRLVALKVLLEGPFAGENTRRRFEREIELAASLRHPNIVTILDSGLSQDRYYFAMEYIDGLRLDRYVAQRRPSFDDTLQLFEKVALAVNYAHQRGVIHRDLKPPNILVDTEGEPHILDFGLAKPVHAFSASESTVRVLSTSGQLLGTIAYMSPEQAAGSSDVDVRTDVYSLGVIFYEALVGRPPYPVDGPLGDVLRRIEHDDPDNPRSLVGQAAGGFKIDDETATILLKALEKEPPRRYQTAGDLARDLRHRLQNEPIEAKRASGLYMLKKTLRRYRWQAATAGGVLVMLLAFLVALAVLFTGEREARRRADEKTDETRLAVQRQEQALQEARERTAEALLAQQNLRRALVRQHVQRGDLALERADLREARDSYWQAFEVAPGPATMWALRRYYLQTSENFAALVSVGPHGPSKLSPSGELVAVCLTPDTIAVRRLRSGAPLNWVQVPGPVLQLDLADDGALAAVGDGWGRAWEPAALAPSVAVQLPDAKAKAAHVLSGGHELLVLWHTSASVYRGAYGENTSTVSLRGSPTAPGDYLAARRELAVPTTAGVELITIPAEGELGCTSVWTGATAARAVRFDGEELLAVLADAVYVARVPELERRGNSTEPVTSVWTRFIDAAADWDLFDLKDGIGYVVFAAHTGRIAAYRSGDLVGTLNNAVEKLEQVRLSVNDRTVVALDEQGTVVHFGEPARIEQRRLIQPGAPSTWATAADGSVTLMAVGHGQVVAYGPEQGGQPRVILRPRLLDFGAEDMALAVSGDGRRAVIRDRATLRLLNLPDGEAHTMVWSHPRLGVAEKVALSGDGELVAILARNAAGDQQQVALRLWDAVASTSRPATPTQPLPPPPEPYDFVGAVVRDLAFVPGTQQILVVRSNGELALLDPQKHWSPASPGLARPPGDLWMTLDSPAHQVAFSRNGEYLAAACDDDTVRLISVGTGEMRKRLPIGRRISALAFNPHDDVLMVRTSTGTIRLFDPATGESLATWRVPTTHERPLATWLADVADAMLLSYETGVYEYRFAEANAIMEQNRAYARERQVARALTDADLPGAWAAATELCPLAPGRGHWAQLMVLETALRRPGFDVPPTWPATVLADASAATYLSLGYAAYSGERFELARDWLHRAYELSGHTLNAMSLCQMAGCDYLTEAYDAAAAELAEAAGQPDLDPALAPQIGLQRVAALLLAGHNAAAREAALAVGEPDSRGRRSDLVAMTYARVIARVLTGIERESAVGTLVDSVVGNVGQRVLLFRDDEFFFAGELARQRGDLAQAAAQYQRGIDTARDPWPANWARYRLQHLPPSVVAQEAGTKARRHVGT